jgi:hypothetical protein
MKSSEAKPVERGGFFSKLFGRGTTQQKRVMRLLKRELGAAKIDLYKIKNDTILPPVAKLIYEVYKLSFPLRQHFLLDGLKKRFLPSFEEGFILCFHSESALAVHEKLGPEYIKKIAEKYGIKKTAPFVEKLLGEYMDLWDRESISNINSTYNNLLGLARFVHFDFFPLLREFDLKLEEADFLKKPSFSSSEGSLLKEDIIKLRRALFRFDVDDTFDRGMEAVEKLVGAETISKGSLAKLKNILKSLQENDYLSLIIRSINRSLSPVPVEKRTCLDIFQVYSQKRRTEVAKTLKSLEKSIRDEAVGSIVSKIFEGSVAGRIKNYQEIHNETFRRYGLPLYRWVDPLNYMKAFITDKYKPSISGVVNGLIVSGIFINKSALNDLSDSYYALGESLDIITAFEEDIDVDGDRGRLMQRLLENVGNEPGAKRALVRNIEEINKRAKQIIVGQIVNLKEMALGLKAIVEDYKKKSPAIIANLKKIRVRNNRQFIEEIIGAYKNIFWILKLLSNYLPLKVSIGEAEQNDVSNEQTK